MDGDKFTLLILRNLQVRLFINKKGKSVVFLISQTDNNISENHETSKIKKKRNDKMSTYTEKGTQKCRLKSYSSG